MRLATIDAGSGPVIVADTPSGLAELGGARPFSSMLELTRAGPGALGAAAEAVRRAPVRHDPGNVRWLAPIPVPESIRDFSVFETHVRQAGARIAAMRGQAVDPGAMEVPSVYRDRPIYYKGNRFACVGHRAPVPWPPGCARLDFELEFGAYLTGTGADVPLDAAAARVFGYTIFNDVSARDVQAAEMAGQLGPAKGKDFDGGNVMGPWLVTADELPDPAGLTMEVRVDGEVWATGTTADMMHSFAEMIAFVSRGETLHPGEFFGSGTVGNGCGLELGRWIGPGAEVSMTVECLGTLTNTMGWPRPVREGTARIPLGGGRPVLGGTIRAAETSAFRPWN
jgi:2-keto-4-pentenoate hydratase/2-oxohepta-3-ene-1,7-dioic acid hydratase in catechol pathway